MVMNKRIFSYQLPLMIGVIVCLLLVWEIIQYDSQQNINAYILSSQELKDEVPEPPSLQERSPEKRFAYAWRLSQNKHYEEAAEQYSQALRIANSKIQSTIFYNLGNLYLRQAIERAEQKGVDSAMAFTDAAKGFYRRSLKIQPEFWQAKYNYETAQRLVRDLPLNTSEGGEGMEEDMEDLWSAMPGFPAGLP